MSNWICLFIYLFITPIFLRPFFAKLQPWTLPPVTSDQSPRWLHCDWRSFPLSFQPLTHRLFFFYSSSGLPSRLGLIRSRLLPPLSYYSSLVVGRLCIYIIPHSRVMCRECAAGLKRSRYGNVYRVEARLWRIRGDDPAFGSSAFLHLFAVLLDCFQGGTRHFWPHLSSLWQVCIPSYCTAVL